MEYTSIKKLKTLLISKLQVSNQVKVLFKQVHRIQVIEYKEDDYQWV